MPEPLHPHIRKSPEDQEAQKQDKKKATQRKPRATICSGLGFMSRPGGLLVHGRASVNFWLQYRASILSVLLVLCLLLHIVIILR